MSHIKLSDFINEGVQYTIKGNIQKGSGDYWPDLNVESDGETYILSQKINGKKYKVILSNKQFKDLCKTQ